MKTEKVEVVRGSGNVFRDFDRQTAEIDHLKAIFAAEIIKLLNKKRLTVRAAQAQTGVAAADISRIRNADLSRFTLDRLVLILNRLGSKIEIKIKVKSTTPRTRNRKAA